MASRFVWAPKYPWDEPGPESTVVPKPPKPPGLHHDKGNPVKNGGRKIKGKRHKK